jgi:hypothetical protein
VADIYLSSMMKPKDEQKDAQREHEKPENKEISLSTEQLQPYAGDYWSSELGVTYRLGIVDHRLKVVAILDGSGFLRTSTLPPEAFGAAATDEFTLSKSPIKIRFERDSNQAISGFKMDAGRTLGMIFTRRSGEAK